MWVKNFVKKNPNYVILNPSDLCKSMFGYVCDIPYSKDFQELFFQLVYNTMVTYENVIIDGLCFDVNHIDAIIGSIMNYKDYKIRVFHCSISMSVVRNQGRAARETLEDIVQDHKHFKTLLLDSLFEQFNSNTINHGIEIPKSMEEYVL